MMDYREHTGLKSRRPRTIGLFVFMSLAALLFLGSAVPALGQSTFGSIPIHLSISIRELTN